MYLRTQWPRRFLSRWRSRSKVGGATSTLPPTDLEVPETTSRSQQPVRLSLWDRAYKSLGERNGRLVLEYEKLLGIELAAKAGEPTDNLDVDGSLDNASNQIDNTNAENRQEQLKMIISSGLQHLDEKKTKYTIFGEEYVVRDQIAQTARFIQSMKVLVGEAVKMSPAASVAWAGVCIILPILTNPSAADAANRDGLTYVMSRIQFYIKFENFLPINELTEELEDCLVNLYQHILEFQIQTVLRFYRTWLRRLGEDLYEDWDGKLQKIKELEKILDDDFRKSNSSAIREELVRLNENEMQSRKELMLLLSILLEQRDKPAALSFSNHGLGSQYNATNGSQNINTGSGKLITGGSFSGVLHF